MPQLTTFRSNRSIDRIEIHRFAPKSFWLQIERLMCKNDGIHWKRVRHKSICDHRQSFRSSIINKKQGDGHDNNNKNIKHKQTKESNNNNNNDNNQQQFFFFPKNRFKPSDDQNQTNLTCSSAKSNTFLLKLAFFIASLIKSSKINIVRPNSLLFKSSLPVFLLLWLLLLGTISPTSSAPRCLSKCSCVYFKNKLQADCSLQQLPSLPQTNDASLALDVQVINLTEHSIRRLRREEFHQMRLINLQRIYLRKGLLEHLENGSFYKLTNLIELDLSWNRFRSIPSEIFISIPKLGQLDLSGNQIEIVPPFAFQVLKALKMLSLESNLIRSIYSKSFLGLLELETLKLRDNQLTHLASESLNPLNRLHTITLSSNRWVCDCRMRTLREYLLLTQRINVIDSPVCQTSTQKWTEMPLHSFLCAPRVVSNSSHVTEVEQGGNLVLECSFQIETMSDTIYSQSEIRWMWHGRSISNNSEGVLSSQRFTIHEYDYYLTGPLDFQSTKTFSTLTPHFRSSVSANSSSLPNNNQLEAVRDFEPIRELESHEFNLSESKHPSIEPFDSISSKFDSKLLDLNELDSWTTVSSKSHEIDTVEPFGSYQVLQRRMRKSRLEITYMLELNQGVYTCEASNAAGHSSANFSVKVVPARHLPSSSSSSSSTTDESLHNHNSQTLTKHSRQQAEQLPSGDLHSNHKENVRKSSLLPTNSEGNFGNEGSSFRQPDGATFESDVGEEIVGASSSLPGENTANSQTKNNNNNSNDRLINASNSIFFGLLLGILFGILLVLLVFSLLIIFFCRKKDAVDDIPAQVISHSVGMAGSCVDLGVHLGGANVNGTLTLGSSLIHPISTMPACAGDLQGLDTGQLIAQYGYITNNQYLTSEPIYKSLANVNIESMSSEKY